VRTPFQDVTERKDDKGKGRTSHLGSCEAMIASEVSLGYGPRREGGEMKMYLVDRKGVGGFGRDGG
jgi:hypothetical protein